MYISGFMYGGCTVVCQCRVLCMEAVPLCVHVHAQSHQVVQHEEQSVNHVRMMCMTFCSY